MDDKAAYWVSVVLSALALLLLVTNVSLFNSNTRMQVQISQRQAAINNGIGLSQLNQGLVQALADASVKDDDKSIRDLLAAQGITVKPKTDAAATTSKK
ncbi:MAG TPA: hypothetical protein VFR09_00805 [Alphaproteobacteria bacterium]|nr:hypothetical protein [Alphaproteobacteria bacterium]